MLRSTLPALGFVLLFATSSFAARPDCEPTTSQAELTTPPLPYSLSGKGEGIYYETYDGDCPTMWCPGNAHGYRYVYEETNGIDGLQRYDEIHDDTCGGAIAGDTIVF